ncbi:MAG: SprT family zinc-dependent metalloprotease [Verrucomicrobiota bacterium]
MDSDFQIDERPLKRGEVVFKEHPRARRYVARVNQGGEIVLTVPRGGTQRDALKFANEHARWLRGEQAKMLQKSRKRTELFTGDRIMVRGVEEEILMEREGGRPVVLVGEERIFVADEGMNLARPLIEHFKKKAKEELPRRTKEIADEMGKSFRRVVVRDQKTRWGSCSSSGEISLNWRLVLTTLGARDYVIIHELTHLNEMNHSFAFWKKVKAACPEYGVYERWLDANQGKVNWPVLR